MEKFHTPPIRIEADRLRGKKVTKSIRLLNQVKSTFQRPEEVENMDASSPVYETECYFPVEDGTEGGLFYGFTKIMSGKVGKEFFMTKGHFHEKIDRGEFYWGVEGEGLLLLMDTDRNSKIEKMTPGSLHYIPGRMAHRTINIGDKPLVFGACWPSDAGHDYETISKNGFSARVFEVDGKPKVIKEN